jgi:hypothetical protein
VSGSFPLGGHIGAVMDDSPIYRRVVADLRQNPRPKSTDYLARSVARRSISAIGSRDFTASKPIKAPNESDEERQVAIGSRLTQPAPAASMVSISDLGAE